jgi:hypothetical protein
MKGRAVKALPSLGLLSTIGIRLLKEYVHN